MKTPGIFILVSILAFATQTYAAQDLECSELVSRLSPADSYRGDKIPTVTQKRLAIEALKEIQPDRYTSTQEIRKAMQEDYAAALSKYYSSRRDCETTRMYLIKMLMKFATTPKLSKQERTATVEMVKSELARPTFPSFRTTNLKIETLTEGFAKKVFENSKSKELLATLKTEQDVEGERLNSLQNSIQPELEVRLGTSSLAELRAQFGQAKNKKKVEELKQFQLAELASVEKLEATFLKTLKASR